MDKPKTKFEQDLKVYFPELYALAQYAQDDEHFWAAVDSVIEMMSHVESGRIYINFTKGHIDGVHKQISMLAHKGRKTLLEKNLDTEQ